MRRQGIMNTIAEVWKKKEPEEIDEVFEICRRLMMYEHKLIFVEPEKKVVFDYEGGELDQKRITEIIER